jgi:hypothetical protein
LSPKFSPAILFDSNLLSGGIYTRGITPEVDKLASIKMNLLKIRKTEVLLLSFALIWIGQASASESSRLHLNESEKQTVKTLLIAHCNNEKSSSFEAKFIQTSNFCDLYKLMSSKLSGDLDSYRSGIHPQDQDTLPAELRPGTSKWPKYGSYLDFETPESFHTHRMTENITITLYEIRELRERLISCLGETGLQSLDDKFAIPDRVLCYVKYGRDGNSLSDDEVSLLKNIVKNNTTIDSKTKADKALNELSNFYYNYRTLASVLPEAEKLRDFENRRNAAKGPAAQVDKEVDVAEYVQINLLIDRRYILEHHGIDGLNKIDDFLKLPESLRSKLAENHELQNSQQDLLRWQITLDLAVHEVQKFAKEARPQIWTKEILNEQALKNVVIEYVSALLEAARFSQDVYVLYSQPNWPKRLEDDLDDNHLPHIAESKMNIVLRDKWILERFADSKAVSQLDNKIKFVYDEDPTVRAPYDHLFQKMFGRLDLRDRITR